MAGSAWSPPAVGRCLCVFLCVCMHVCIHTLTGTKGRPTAGLTSWMMLETLSQLACLMFSPPSTRPS